MGICGSCGMNVDGEPRLTCATFLDDYAPGPVRVEPLANFPIARDLVVDLTDFMEKLPRVKPWIIRDDDAVLGADSEIDGEYLQTPEELDAYHTELLQKVTDRLGTKYRGLEVRGTVVEGDGGLILDKHLSDAALLVLGTRRHGPAVGTLLGSTVQHLLHHGGVPIAIVPNITPAEHADAARQAARA